MRWIAGGLVALVSSLAIGAVDDVSAGSRDESARVSRVIDGDTIDLASGARVRLLQIDTPEPGTGECYSRAAGRELRRLLPVGASVVLEVDPQLDRVDAYGRLLRYVRRAASTSTSSRAPRGGDGLVLPGRARPLRGPAARRSTLGAQRPPRHLGRMPGCRLESARPRNDGARLGRPGRHDTWTRDRRQLRPVLPDRLHRAAATRPRLRRHPAQALPCSPTGPARLRWRGRRSRLRALTTSGTRGPARRGRRRARCRRRRTRAGASARPSAP